MSTIEDVLPAMRFERRRGIFVHEGNTHAWEKEVLQQAHRITEIDDQSRVVSGQKIEWRDVPTVDVEVA